MHYPCTKIKPVVKTSGITMGNNMKYCAKFNNILVYSMPIATVLSFNIVHFEFLFSPASDKLKTSNMT